MKARSLILSLLASCTLAPALFAAAPLNDNIVRAFGITGTNQTVRGENKGATPESWEAPYTKAFQGKSVWWYLDAPAEGRVTIKTEGSNFDTVLLVFTYSNGKFLPAALNDNAGNGISWSQLTLPLRKGTRYYIGVDGAGGAEGQIVLSVNRGEASTSFTGATTYSAATNAAPAQGAGGVASTKSPPTTPSALQPPKTAPSKTSVPATNSVKPPVASAPKTALPARASTTIQGPIPPTVITPATALTAMPATGSTPDDYRPPQYPRIATNNATNPLNITWDAAFDLNDPTLSNTTRLRTSSGEIMMRVVGRRKEISATENWQTGLLSPFRLIRHLSAGRRPQLFEGYGVWWKWTAPEDGQMSIKTFGNEFGTTLHVFERDIRTANYTSNDTTVTATIPEHGLQTGQMIRIVDVPLQWVGKHRVTITGPNTFTFPNPNPPLTGLGVILVSQGGAGADGAKTISYTSNPTAVTGTTIVDVNGALTPIPHLLGAITINSVIEPKQWAGVRIAISVNATTFTFANPNPSVNGTLTCLLTDARGGIAANPLDGRRLLAMNDDSDNGTRTSHVRLPVRKGTTYHIGVDLDTPNLSGFLLTNSKLNSKLNFTLGFVSESRGVPPTKNLDPFVTTQPLNQAVNANATATFSGLAVQGTQPFTYQWRLNGVPVVGNTSANTATLTIPNVHPMNVGNYTVVVTDLFGKVISAPASLTINNYPITITSQPNNQTVNNGTPLTTFSATVSGVTTYLSPGNPTYFNYTWYKNNGTTTIVQGPTDSNSTTSTYQITNATPADIANYYVVARDTYRGTVYETNATSNNGTLAITNYPITITSQPNNQTVTAGNNATFTVAANGVAPITYQWYKDNGTVTMVGTNNATLTLTSVTPSDTGTYYVIVRDGFAGTSFESNATSNNATLTVP